MLRALAMEIPGNQNKSMSERPKIMKSHSATPGQPIN